MERTKGGWRGACSQPSPSPARYPLALGLTSGNTIWLDDNAPGWGWFVDSTPHNDSEFTMPGDQGEQHRMGLLTVLTHELSHLLGQGHEADGLMAEPLTAGTRRVRSSGSNSFDVAGLDGVFTDSKTSFAVLIVAWFPPTELLAKAVVA
jgi:hypothetical protein